jgi:hypothetical protein
MSNILENSKEVWKDIPGLEGRYQASNFGGIRSCIDGRIRVRKTAANRQGYIVLPIKDAQGKYFTKYVHRLIALAFIPNPVRLKDVNHKNGIKSDNRIENLEWCSRQYNVRHAYDTGLNKPLSGFDNPNNKLDKEQIISIFNDNRTTDQICDAFKISTALVIQIKNGSAWSSITGKKYKPAYRVDKEIIKKLYCSPLQPRDLEKIYGISAKLISSIRTGKKHSKTTKSLLREQ